MSLGHIDTIREMVKAGIQEKGIPWNPNQGQTFLEFLNELHGTNTVEERGFSKIQNPPEDVEVMAGKVGKFYGNGKICLPHHRVKVSPFNVDIGIKQVTYSDPSKKKLSTFDSPEKSTESYTDAKMLELIMDAFQKLREGNMGTKSYHVSDDTILSSDKTLFGTRFDEVHTPLSDLLDADSPGLLKPYRYVGTKFSVFPVHVEDLQGIQSCHVLVLGAAKVWIVIPKSSYALLLLKCQVHLQKVLEFVPGCVLLHKDLWLDLDLLLEWNIPFSVVVQRAGETLVTGDLAFHQGFNLGNNYGSAINLILDPFLFNIRNDNTRMTCNCPADSPGHTGYVNLSGEQYELLNEIRLQTMQNSSVSCSDQVEISMKQCIVCQKLVSRKNYARHINLHSTEKSFPCSVCGMEFREKEYLQNHSRTHKIEKEFNCNLCTSSYKQRCSLSRHKRLNH